MASSDHTVTVKVKVEKPNRWWKRAKTKAEETPKTTGKRRYVVKCAAILDIDDMHGFKLVKCGNRRVSGQNYCEVHAARRSTMPRADDHQLLMKAATKQFEKILDARLKDGTLLHEDLFRVDTVLIETVGRLLDDLRLASDYDELRGRRLQQLRIRQEIAERIIANNTLIDAASPLDVAGKAKLAARNDELRKLKQAIEQIEMEEL